MPKSTKAVQQMSPFMPRTMRFHLTFSVLGCLLLASGCSDVSAPTNEVRRYVGHGPRNSMGLYVDWYNCASTDGGQTWDCYYDHTEESGSGLPDYWDNNNVFHTASECSMAARYCDNNFQAGMGSSPYADPREVGRGDPEDDLILSIPSCPASATAPPATKAYCAGHAPDATELDLIRAALDRMRQTGGICSTLAGIGDALLAHSPPTLRLYPQGSYENSGHAPVGGGSNGPDSWAVISEDLARNAPDASHWLWFQNGPYGLWYKATLQTVLAHELDHLNGSGGHISENGSKNVLVTPNTRLCSDVDMGSGLTGHP